MPTRWFIASLQLSIGRWPSSISLYLTYFRFGKSTHYTSISIFSVMLVCACRIVWSARSFVLLFVCMFEFEINYKFLSQLPGSVSIDLCRRVRVKANGTTTTTTTNTPTRHIDDDDDHGWTRIEFTLSFLLTKVIQSDLSFVSFCKAYYKCTRLDTCTSRSKKKNVVIHRTRQSVCKLGFQWVTRAANPPI